MKEIYLDYAATTPVDERVYAKMQPFFMAQFGNPSSLYAYGREAGKAVRNARAQVAELLQADPSEIFFTSGGSESDNWALKGMAFALRRAGRGNHIITTQIEHHAVLNTCKWLEQEGFAVTYLPADAEGRVTLADVCKAVRQDTIIVSIMTANNEVGTIEPIAEIGAWLQDEGIFFHTDAVQAAGHIPLAVNELNVDALSLSGHKLYGPKGIGVLYLRRGFVPDALIHGGAQERELRAGTENTAGIVGLGEAAAIAKTELCYRNFLEDMLLNAKIYMRIVNPRREDYNNRKEYFWLVQSLNALNNYFNVVRVRIALLALFDVKDRDVIDLKMLKSTVLYLENFHFAYNAILSGKANRLEKIYSTFAINLRKATNKAEAQTIIQTKLVEPLDQLFPTFEDFYKKFIALTYSKKDNPSNAKTKYAINKLNCYLSRKEIFEDDGSVEHLVPESDGEYSLGIGNLILLEQQLNSDAGQETYTKKQETYKNPTIPG